MEAAFTYRKPANESVGDMVVFGIWFFFFGLALFNLAFLRPLETVPLLASIAWVSIISFSFVSNCWTLGLRQHCIDLLGGCVRNRFVRVEQSDSGDQTLGFGFVFASRCFSQLKFKSEGIRTIDWNMGQSSGRTGKDMDDWHVVVWFDVTSIVYNANGNELGICLVGQSGSKEEMESYGYSFIEFLRQNHIELPSPTKSLHGVSGIVIEDLDPIGKIRIGDEEFVGHADESFITKEDRIYLSDVRGTSVYVKKEAAKTDGKLNSVKAP